MLYHGVSAMAMKGLVDMGANIGSNSDQSFSQLPTQSVCLSRDFKMPYMSPGDYCSNIAATNACSMNGVC